MRASLIVAAIAVAPVVLLAPAPATAFVCTRVVDNTGAETGPSLSWFTRTVRFSLFAQGTNDIPGTDEFQFVRAAFEPWENAQGCSPPNDTTDLVFSETVALSTIDRIGFDFLAAAPTETTSGLNENLLIFRDSNWPHLGQEAFIIALTTTTFNALSGEIFDADIEFNSANFDFTTTDSGVQTDLMNTAVHEIGHVLGLGHVPRTLCTGTCTVSSPTMCAEAQPGETCKRDLACDDLNAMVFKYPAGQPNGYCDPPTADCGFCAPPGVLTRTPAVSVRGSDDGGGGCTTAAPTAGAAVLVLLAMTRRRRQ